MNGAGLLRRVSLAFTALLGAGALTLAHVPVDAASQSRERVAYVSVAQGDALTPVRDLSPKDIIIREDGVRREVLRVVPATSPMPIAVLIDNSQAAVATIPDLRAALKTFLPVIDGLGPVALFTVADRPTVLQEYTTSSAQALAAAARLFHAPDSGATLLEAINDVARGLAKREADRAAMVVVTSEYTEFSTLQYTAVLDSLDDSGVMMHAIVFLNPAGSISTDEARNRAVVLDRGPRESGGVRTDVLTSMAFEARLRQVGELLKAQHRVTYARPESLIPPEKFEVAAVAAGHVAYGAPARGQAER